MPNKLSQFWQELKRRNVVRVITVYAGAAFVILELVDMVREPFELPNWSFKLVIIILSIGFIITVIVSWIYDIHPEGGIVKTEPVEKVKAEDTPKSSSSWRVASYISFVVIVGLIVLNIIPRDNKNRIPEVQDKSIAVLPFESLSDDPEKQYQADGVMDAILLHLSKIEDLRVISRTSVEQYRGTAKTVNEICEELDVAYILEGSYRRYGDQARLIVQLIQTGKEGHVWANQYDRDWGDIFAVESEVAQSVAGELQAVITPEVKERIEKAPTSSLTAYDFYQRGREEQWKYSSRVFRSNPSILDQSENLYRQALQYDPAFPLAYAGLAEIYFEKYLISGSLDVSKLDSAYILAERALSNDPQLALAHSVIGRYFLMKGNNEQASREFEMASKLNPNDYEVYANQGSMYYWLDCAKSIYNFRKAASLLSGISLANILNELSNVYNISGFEDQAFRHATESLALGGDSIEYYRNMAYIAISGRDFQKANALFEKILSENLGDQRARLALIFLYSVTGEYDKAIKYSEELAESGDTLMLGYQNNRHRVGFAYWQTGDKVKANACFDQMITFCDSVIELGWSPFQFSGAFYDKAATCAFLGKKEEAFENLRHYSQAPIQGIMGMKEWLKADDPLFDSIRVEPEFQQIVHDVEARYQAEHERIRQWLEENEML